MYYLRYITWHKHMSFKDIYSIYMSFTSNLDIYMLLNSTWCLKYTCIPWLYCRNGMRDPEIVGPVVWSGKEGSGVETVEAWKSRTVSQNKSYGLDELLCKFVEVDTNTSNPSVTSWTVIIGEVSRVRRNSHWRNWWGFAWYRILFDTWLMHVAEPSDLVQRGPRSYEFQFWDGRRINLLLGAGRQLAWVWQVEHAVHDKNKHMVALVLMAFKWQSTKEGGLLKDSPFKEWLASRPLALWPIYWEIGSNLYTRFKMGYEREVGNQIFGVLCYVEHSDDYFARGERGALW